MKHICRFIALLFWGGFNLPFVSSQAAPVATDHGVARFLVSAKSKNSYLNDLAAADIQIKENGHPVQRQELRKLNDARMRYCILFDTSSSVKGDLKVERRAALEILQQTVNPDTDSGWLVVVNTEPTQEDETHDPMTIGRLIIAARPGGGTALYDAMAQCAQRMASGLPYPLRRVMFIFSYGGDDTSKVSANAALQAFSARVYLTYRHHQFRSVKIFFSEMLQTKQAEKFLLYTMKKTQASCRLA